MCCYSGWKPREALKKKSLEFNFRKVILYHQCWEDSAGICFPLVRKNDLEFSNRHCRVWSSRPQGVSISLWVQPQERALMGTHMQTCLPTEMQRLPLPSYREDCNCGKAVARETSKNCLCGRPLADNTEKWIHL